MKGKESLVSQADRNENSFRNQKIENFMERKKREDRKNNIIIRGVVWEEISGKLKEKVENFIKEKIKVSVEVKYARKVGTFEQKISIMENKKNLGEEEIYIENDRTKKKREIQRKIANIAKAEKEKNSNMEIKISHWKLRLNGIDGTKTKAF